MVGFTLPCELDYAPNKISSSSFLFYFILFLSLLFVCFVGSNVREYICIYARWYKDLVKSIQKIDVSLGLLQLCQTIILFRKWKKEKKGCNWKETKNHPQAYIQTSNVSMHVLCVLLEVSM